MASAKVSLFHPFSPYMLLENLMLSPSYPTVYMTLINWGSPSI